VKDWRKRTGADLARVHQRHRFALRREEASAAVAALEDRRLHARLKPSRQRVNLANGYLASCHEGEDHLEASQVATNADHCGSERGVARGVLLQP
jgi:hypothetical protein